MCGRYSLALRPSQVREYLENEDMPVWGILEDDGDHAPPRQSYNFAPGYHGLVYRADVPDWGAGPRHHKAGEGEMASEDEPKTSEKVVSGDVHYKLQSMKWGLIPFWTKRNPDYGSMLKTINCRDDSLLEPRGMWNTMKQRKRCIVIAQGFYEWLKKNNGKERLPHYTKRKDGKLMCMAGLWDCAQYEGSDEKLYTYTIITTSSNNQLNFLHDRMPVILENGSEDMRKWLDPKRYEWSDELQSLLKPYEGELEIYPVNKDVGKVGNNSPTFIVPIDSKDNPSNIANFFGSAKPKTKSESAEKKGTPVTKEEPKTETTIKKEPDEDRETVDHSGTEDNAPLPVPNSRGEQGLKRERVDDVPDDEPPKKILKTPTASPTKRVTPAKSTAKTRSRDATSNHTASPQKLNGKDKGSQKITSFFTSNV